MTNLSDVHTKFHTPTTIPSGMIINEDGTGQTNTQKYSQVTTSCLELVSKFIVLGGGVEVVIRFDLVIYQASTSYYWYWSKSLVCWVVVMLKTTLVFIFGPNLNTMTLLLPRPKLNNNFCNKRF